MILTEHQCSVSYALLKFQSPLSRTRTHAPENRFAVKPQRTASMIYSNHRRCRNLYVPVMTPPVWGTTSLNFNQSPAGQPFLCLSTNTSHRVRFVIDTHFPRRQELHVAVVTGSEIRVSSRARWPSMHTCSIQHIQVHVVGINIYIVQRSSTQSKWSRIKLDTLSENKHMKPPHRDVWNPQPLRSIFPPRGRN